MAESLDDFLQRASLNGLSKADQDEVIAEFFADEISMFDAASDMLASFWSAIKRNRVKLMVLLAILLLFGYYLHVSNEARLGNRDAPEWLMRVDASLRILQKKLQPYVDIGSLFYVECLVSNPYLQLLDWYYGEEYYCDEPVITTLKEQDSHLVKEGKAKLPFVIKRAQKGWYLNSNSNIRSIVQEFKQVSSTTSPCFEFPGFEGPTGDESEYLDKFEKGELMTPDGKDIIDSVIVSGCSKLSNRIIRNFTLRPRFLGSSAESLGTMRLILVKNHLQSSITLDLRTDAMTWVANIVGSVRIRLAPDCDEGAIANVTLNAGDILALDGGLLVDVEMMPDSNEHVLVSSEFSMDISY